MDPDDSNIETYSESSSDRISVYLAEYNNLWREITTRLQMRERLGVFSITIQGALLAVAIGARPVTGIPESRFHLVDILLISPFVAGVLQTMLMRQVVRSALLTNYLLTELRERVGEAAGFTGERGGETGPFGWLMYANRSLQLGTRLDTFLASVEFSMPMVFALFNVAVYVILVETPNFNLLIAFLSLWIFFFIISIALGLSAYQMHVDHTSPEKVVRTYLDAVCKKDLHHALRMIDPACRDRHLETVTSCLGRALVGIRVDSRMTTYPYERLIVVDARTEQGASFGGEYRLKLVHQLWYISVVVERTIPQNRRNI
jgi:hypothetical protein